MALYTALELPVEKRIEIVKAYLIKGSSLRKIARLYGISYMTLWRWVKRYKNGGKESLKKKVHYKQSHKRFSSRIEKKVMLLKEHEPCLTTKKAVHLLKQQGLPISHNGVWMIWKRYGLVKRPKDDPLSLICSGTPEIENGMQQARQFIKNGDIKNAAKILNKLPCLTDPSILKQIPDGLLLPRRRLEQLHFLFLSKTMPLLDLFNEVRKIRKTMEKSGYLFSSIFAGFLEVIILQWMKVPEKQLKILNLISKRMAKVRDKSLRFTLYMLLAITYGKLLHVNDAIVNIRKCHRLLSSLPYPFYWLAFGDTLITISRGKEGILCFKKIIEEMAVEQTPNQIFYMKIAHGYVMTGQYQQAQKFLNQIRSKEIDVASVTQIKANICFAHGRLEEAVHFCKKSLGMAKTANFHNIIFAASLGLAQIAQALGKQKEAYAILKKCLPLMKKYQMKSEILVLQSFINRIITIPKRLYKFPVYRLLFLLQRAAKTLHTKDYYDALRFAGRRGLLGIFHRYIVFFPEPILHFLEKGKPAGLPKAILKFPIFNQKKAVYLIRLLGNIIVYKNQQYVKAKLMPKEKALLIHLTLKAGEPGKSILSVDLYRNFWPDSKNPSNLLSHLLVRLKKKLRLPGHLLMISSRYGEPRLVNRGVYLTTDYNDFKVALTHAKALERADEWLFARREYMQAFKLFRGEPFKKMYDPWSEHMRRVILNELENTTLEFAKRCLEHKNKTDAKKVLEKVLKIIPQSEDSAKMMQTL